MFIKRFDIYYEINSNDIVYDNIKIDRIKSQANFEVKLAISNSII